MKTLFILTVAFVATSHFAFSQDTFSIVAVDSTTGEVGSAGASCVDLFLTSISDDGFLGKLFPGVGAINTQAYYIPANQNNATDRMNLGETPDEIIQWLVANDIAGQPELRQYGIAAMINGSPETAAHTGSSTDDYKNHITGPNYSIQGNILLGQEVLDSMESRFLNAEGDLACKLMAALQGANMVGADTRCGPNGSSSLFAFVKVAQPSDTFGAPSFSASVRSSTGEGFEPIDSLQTLFDSSHECAIIDTSTRVVNQSQLNISFTPNPTTEYLNIKYDPIFTRDLIITISSLSGEHLVTCKPNNALTIDLTHLDKGMYILKAEAEGAVFTTKFFKE